MGLGEQSPLYLSSVSVMLMLEMHVFLVRENVLSQHSGGLGQTRARERTGVLFWVSLLFAAVKLMARRDDSANSGSFRGLHASSVKANGKMGLLNVFHQGLQGWGLQCPRDDLKEWL